MDLKLSFSLRGEASLWLFLRTNDKFDEFTSIIRFYKEEKSKKIFIQFGTFFKDESNKNRINNYNNNDYKNLSENILPSEEILTEENNLSTISNLRFCFLLSQQLIEITSKIIYYHQLLCPKCLFFKIV